MNSPLTGCNPHLKMYFAYDFRIWRSLCIFLITNPLLAGGGGGGHFANFELRWQKMETLNRNYGGLKEKFWKRTRLVKHADIAAVTARLVFEKGTLLLGQPRFVNLDRQGHDVSENHERHLKVSLSIRISPTMRRSFQVAGINTYGYRTTQIPPNISLQTRSQVRRYVVTVSKSVVGQKFLKGTPMWGSACSSWHDSIIESQIHQHHQSSPHVETAVPHIAITQRPTETAVAHIAVTLRLMETAVPHVAVTLRPTETAVAHIVVALRLIETAVPRVALTQRPTETAVAHTVVTEQLTKTPVAHVAVTTTARGDRT